MHSVRVFQVDAFTARRFTGNPAGVVLDAEGLSSSQMRAIARELGAADCAFALPPERTSTRTMPPGCFWRGRRGSPSVSSTACRASVA